MQCNGNGRFANFHLMHVQHLKKKKIHSKADTFFFFFFFHLETFFILKKRIRRTNKRVGRNYMLSKQIRKEWSRCAEPSSQK